MPNIWKDISKIVGQLYLLRDNDEKVKMENIGFEPMTSTLPA